MALSILALFSELAEQDIRLWLDDGQLRFNAPEGAFTAEIKEQVLSRKAEIIAFLQSAEHLSEQSISKQSREQLLPLSYAQQRLWILDQLEPGSPTFNIPAAFLLSGKLNTKLLKESFEQIIDRHESLRTVFENKSHDPQQTIQESHSAIGEWWFFDDQYLMAGEKETRQLQLVLKNIRHRFSLSDGPLIRVSLFQKSDQEFLLLLNMHHIISDAESVNIFIQELVQNYSALENNESSVLPELPIQYADFSIWQRQLLGEDKKEKQLAYWKDQLQAAESLQLPLDKDRPAVFTERGATYSFELPADTSAGLHKLAEDNGVTLFVLMLSIYKLFLSRYSSQKDISVGTPISNRPSSELESLLGFFGNTLVLRSEINNDLHFIDHLKQVESTSLAAFSNQDIPFEMLVDELVKERDLSNSPLFQTMFTLTQSTASDENTDKQLKLGKQVVVEVLDNTQESAKYDFSLSISANKKSILGGIEYCVDLFTAKTIEQMTQHFLRLVEDIVRRPDKKLFEYSFIEKDNIKKQIVDWNNTHKNYSALCLHELIEQQAEKTPEALALVFEDECLSYRELTLRSTLLAKKLIDAQVEAGEGVAICLDRSADMVIALLATLKAGAFYIPIDPEYPQDRIDYVLDHSKPRLIITSSGLKYLIANQHPVLLLDEINIKESTSDLKIERASNQNGLAYTIYTSGSTGLPKGVAVSHRAFVNFIDGMKDTLGLTQSDKVLCLTSLSFDIAGLEIWLPLVNGATLVMASKEDAADQDRLKHLVESKKISLLQATPATWQMLLATDWRKQKDNKEKNKVKALCGGEALPLALARKLIARNLELFNMYGPTETTVWSAVKKIEKEDQKIFIGKAINNTQLYVLDDYFQPVPTGAIGELYIAGDGLAEGYLKQDQLTAERFIENPFVNFDKHTSKRMYRTGDLARWVQDFDQAPELECLGRVDSQVKVRGFRIELGEIESVIKLNNDVADAAVVVKQVNNEKQICAYVVLDVTLDPNKESSTEDSLLEIKSAIKAQLAKKLPAYMLPSHLEYLSELPLTPNGKVDRKSLPNPVIAKKAHVKAENERQEHLVEIWSSILNLERISIDDNFFELGGQSLLATQAMSKIRESFDLDLPLRLFFENPSIRNFERALSEKEVGAGHYASAESPIVAIERPKNIPLSFAQQRLWFLDQLAKEQKSGSSAYHIPMALRLRGELDCEHFELAIKDVIARHESLRTHFVSEHESVYQVIDANPNWQLQQYDCSDLTQNQFNEKLESLAMRPFDLSQDSLLRVCVMRRSTNDNVLLVVMHHIVSDAWSMDILIREVLIAYQKGIDALPKLELQYADFTLWQQESFNNDVGGKLNQQLNYWKDALTNVPVLQLPADRVRPSQVKNLGASVPVVFNEKLSSELKSFCDQNNCTVFMVLMSAYQVLLSRYSGQNDFAVGTPIANREQEALQSMVGFFVNTLAVRSELENGQNFIELVAKVKNSLLNAYANQTLPFEQLVDVLAKEGLERDLSHSPIFQVMLVVNNLGLNRHLNFEGLEISPFSAERKTAKFDLTLEINEQAQGFSGELEYSSELFEKNTAELIAKHFIFILKSLLASPLSNVQIIPLLDSDEQQEQLQLWNTTNVKDSYIEKTLSSACLHESFEKQVQLNPNVPALIHKDISISYSEVNKRANQLAHYLVKQNVVVGDVIGICLPACPDLLVSVLAVLKVGATYLPMDVQYPEQRLAFFIEDSACKKVITHKALQSRLSTFSASKQAMVICLDSELTSLAEESESNLNLTLSPENFLYVIYTSGSTGQPNRTATSHRKEANLLQWYQDFGMSKLDRVLLLSAVGFDLTQKNFFAPLLSGAAIVLPEHAHYDAESLLNTIEKHQVTWMNCAPSAFYPIVELNELAAKKSLASLRFVFLGGEPIALSRLHTWHAKSSCEIINSYGPTECTDVSHFHVLSKNHTQSTIPIGRCIPNVRQYVFDENLQLLPRGAVGELYLGGESVGPGYLNNEALTRQRFIENPFKAGERLYKTGDLVRMRKDSELEYIGRRDFQVKIRGVRIELAEIEQALLQDESVKACTVIVRNAKDDDHKFENGFKENADYLCAYLVIGSDLADLATDPNKGIETEKEIARIKKQLKQGLPSFMQPQYFVMLEALPLTPNGKIDRKLLPIPEIEKKAFIAPSTEHEIALANIWLDVLGLNQKISTLDNFFELGGHSLLATRVVSKIRTQFKQEVPLSKIFELENLAALADYLDSSVHRSSLHSSLRSSLHSAEIIQLEHLNTKIAHPLSFGQQRLWFLEKLNPGSSMYHMPAVLKLKGSLNIGRLEESVLSLVQEQAILRTKIYEEKGVALQSIDNSSHKNKHKNNWLKLIDLQKESATKQRKAIEEILFSPFDFAESLFRIALINTSEQEYLLVLVMHHIIADGWSVDIMLQSLLSNYFQKDSVSKLSHQYIDFSQWQRKLLSSGQKDKALSFWQDQLFEVSALELPTDYIRPTISENLGAKHSFELGATLTKQVKGWAKQNHATNFMVLFSAYQVLLARLSGQVDFAIGTPIANRNHESLEEIIGFFVNTLALPSQLDKEINFSNLVKKVKAQSIQAHEYQWLPFELIVDELQVERSLTRTPIFQAMFVLQESAFSQNAFSHDHDFDAPDENLSIQSSGFTTGLEHQSSKFEITLEMSEGANGFEASFEYDRSLFSTQTMALYAKYFSYLLAGLVTKSENKVFTLPLEDSVTTQNTLKRFNDNVRDYPRDSSLVEIFEGNVDKFPQAIALEDEARTLSYLELDDLANAFAQQLIQLGIKANDRVALYFDRGIDFVVALLACHKASAVYVPINPDYPKDRRDYILKDSASTALIYQSGAQSQALEDSLTFPHIQIINIQNTVENIEASAEANTGASTSAKILTQRPKRKEASSKQTGSRGNRCAAVLYTSGSTGEPKGVQLTHRGIARLVINSNYFSADETDCFAMVNNICFDASSYEIWGALLNGSRAVVFSPDVVLSPNAFKKQNAVHGATCMLVPTGLFHNTVAENPSTFLGVKNLLIGGEAVDIQLAHQVLDHSKPEHFINVYGPTENATITTTWEIGGIKKFGQKVNIGAPIANTSVYIVDQDLNLLPTGVPGELLCAGDGLSLGYQNKKTFNQRNFIDHPFADIEKLKTPDEENLQAYRTGDFARYLANGELEFLGRMDQQVKIRGYRVEPDEVAAVINGLNSVEHATVVAITNKKSQSQALHLVAYYVEANSDLSPAALKSELAEILPGYLVPSLCVKLNEIPLTPNGKIDRRVLPEPNWQEMSQQKFLAPKTKLQKQIAQVWQSLLGLERVGLNENFFEIGGNSLSATRVISQCSEVFGEDIPLRALFESPSLSAFCDALEKSTFEKVSEIVKADRSKPLPLSYSQQRMWFLDKLNERSTTSTASNVAYHIPFVLKLKGPLNSERLEKSLQLLCERHESLRTSFTSVPEKEQVQQIIHSVSTNDNKSNSTNASQFNLEIIDAQDLDTQQISKKINFIIAKPFYLEQLPLLRASLLKINANEAIIVLVLHHIIGDAWSLDILAKELFQLYEGRNIDSLPVLSIQYADFALWQQQQEQKLRLTSSLDYWLNDLAEVSPLQLPLDKKRPAINTYAGASVPFSIDKALYSQLKALSDSQGLTVFMSMLAAFQIMLARYSGQNDFAIGAPIANRNHPQLENVFGFFANTLALKNDYRQEGQQSYVDLLALVKQRMLNAYSHQQVPFEKIVESLAPERNLSFSPIFQVMLVINNQSSKVSAVNTNKDLAFSVYENERNTSKFDLTLELTEVDNNLEGLFEFNSDIFETETITQFAENFTNLLTVLLDKPSEPLNHISFLDAQVLAKLESWSKGEQQDFKLSNDQGLAYLIQEQVQTCARQIAVRHNKDELTYLELEQQSNQFANYLLEQGVAKGDLVGVCLEQSLDIAVVLYAILKLGAAYIPFDPSFPEERIAKVQHSSQFKVLIKHFSISINCAASIVDIDKAEWKSCTAQFALPKLDNTELAYVIYTSGSTGEPKGVAIEHRSLLNYLSWAKQYYAMTDLDVSLCALPLSFDAVITTLFLPLISGKVLEFVDRDVDLLDAYLSKGSTSVTETEQNFLLKLTPAHLNFYQQRLSEHKVISQTQKHRFVIGGDQLRYQDIEYCLQAFPESIFTNEYGPTESTVGCVVEDFFFKKLSAERIEKLKESNALLIGKPIANTQIYLLDNNQQAVAPGVVGELCIAGEGLAREYLNDALTSKRSFLDYQGVRIYRSGDLAQYQKDGSLLCLGRQDNQIKLRGVRIELGDIEQALLNCHEVKDAYVLFDKEDEAERLIAYVVCDESSIEQVRQKIELQLPSMMRPANYVCLAGLPLTENGKVDVKQLVLPARQVKAFIAPSTDTEKTLASIWQDTLGEVKGVDQIGIHDNFFELGGHSLLATRVLSKLRLTLEKEIKLVKLFEYPVLSELANYIDTLAEGEALGLIPLADRNAPLLLSHSQQRIWFLEQLNPGSVFYHMPALVKLSGNFDVERFEARVRFIIERHENLRTTFVTVEGEDEPHQVINALGDWQLERIHLSDSSEASMKAKAAELLMQPFDLSVGPLFRMHLLREDENTYYLVAVMHHIISDGWSIELLLKEIISTYLLGETVLSPLAIQYADYAQWQRTELVEVLAEQESYWCEQLADVPALQLPVDRIRPALESHRGSRIGFELDKVLTQKLKTFSEQQGATLFMSAMAAFQVLLNRYSGQSDFAVGTPIANRNHPQVENLIGCFINTLAIRADLEAPLSFESLLAQVKATTLAAFNHQELPFEKIVDALRLERNLSHAPIFQAMLVVNNQAPTNNLTTGDSDLSISMVEGEHVSAKFDINLALSDLGERIAGSLEYNVDLFDEATAQQMVEHFKTLLIRLLDNSSEAVQNIAFLEKHETEKRCLQAQGKQVSYDVYENVADYLAQALQANESASALRMGDESISYQALHERSEQLAIYLQAEGLKPQAPVALCLARSVDMVVSILAAIKAGSPYLPLDPSLPQERLDFMLEDSGAQFVLTQQNHVQDFSFENVINLSNEAVQDAIKKKAAQSDGQLQNTAKPDDIFNIIYTSGSTGNPKGVMVTHAGILNRIQWMQAEYQLTSSDKVLQKTTYSFDVSVWEFIWPLSQGACLVLAKPDGHKDPEYLSQLMLDEKISHCHFVPSMLSTWLDSSEQRPPALQKVFCSGEALSREAVNQFYEALPDCELHNLYGPTEAAIDVSYWHCEKGLDNQCRVPIGKAVANTQLWVLDSAGQLTAPGVAGELHIGGVQLARGYLNRDDLNASTFIEHEIKGDANRPGKQRLYKTGDLVRQRRDGVIEYLGRIDHQVKIRGYRIELGEIETRLQSIDSVALSVVVAERAAGTLQTGDQQLVAYVSTTTPAKDKDLLIQHIKSELGQHLPSYMVPTLIMVLDEMPLLNNGKINRKALPKAEFQQAEFIAPSTDTEKTLASIWQEVLGVEKIGIHDNFFELGGHSLLATRVVSRIRNRLNINLALVEIFNYVELKALADFIDTLIWAKDSLSEHQPVENNKENNEVTNGENSGVHECEDEREEFEL